MSNNNNHEALYRRVGGVGEIREGDPEVQEIVDNIKDELEVKTGKKYESVKVVHYRTQLVAGINYFVKVSINFY